MIRFTAILICTAAFALAVPVAASAAPAAPSQSMRPPSAAMSALAAAGAKVSASLSQTSFQASRVGSVKLRYSFSKRSKHFRYRLSFKSGSSWQTVNRVKKTGRFKVSHTLIVKKVFAVQPVKVGRYRLKLTAEGSSTTLPFAVTSAPPAVVKPEAGLWHSASLSGPYKVVGGTAFTDSMEVTQLFFEVAPDRATISKFGFSYDYSGPFPSGQTCSGSANSVESEPSPITNGQFSDPGITAWSGGTLFRFQGTFDSPTTAHGTAQFGTTITDIGCTNRIGVATGTFTWTATR